MGSASDSPGDVARGPGAPGDDLARPARPGTLRAGITLYFIRHGETDWNAEARYQGQTDIPLNDKGRGQARRNGQVLRREVAGIETVDFVASPLGRTRETIEIVRSEIGLPREGYAMDARLKEMNYGHWEGKLAVDLPRLDPEGLKARRENPYFWRPVGGENYSDVVARLGAWLAGVTRDCVVVSHGGVSRALRGHLLGLDPFVVPRLEVPQDRILVVRQGMYEWL